jgi:hypothetical protein
MGLLDENRPTNPAKHFINIKNGGLSYYSKEEGQDVSVATPFEFIVLDQLATVKGWSGSEDTGIWSNEVQKVGSQQLNVRTQNGVKASGLWKDIKDEVKADGGNFYAVVYLAAKGRESLETQALLLKGAALNAWVEFTKKTNLKTNKVILSDWLEAKKGSIKYKVPVFTAVAMTDSELAEAKTLAVELRAYHTEYFSYNPDKHNEETSNQKDVVTGDEDTSIDLSDIPF